MICHGSWSAETIEGLSLARQEKVQEKFPNGTTCPVVTPILVPRCLAYKGQWGPQVRSCVGMATYCEAAMKIGIWETTPLERELRRRADSDAPTHGTFRAFLHGGAPSGTTVTNLDRSLPDAAVAFWANHPIFHMLDCARGDKLFDPVMTYAIDSIWGTVREHFWPWGQTGSEPGSANPGLEIFMDGAAIASALNDRAAVEALSDIDWLVLNMASYFLAKRANHLAIAKRAADTTSRVFSTVVHQYPQLLVTWLALEKAMAARIWNVEGIDYRHQAVLCDPKNVVSTHLHSIFPPELIALAEENEALALRETVNS